MTAPQMNGDDDMGDLVPLRPNEPEGGDELAPADEHAVADTGPVYDGEIVTEAEYQASRARRAVQRVQAHPVVVTARTVATHDRTRTAGKAAVRNVLYVPAGAGVLARRAWEAKTNSRYERILRAAEAAGDWERMADWEQRAEQARERRHKRRMDWLEAPGKLVRALAVGVAALVAVLLAIGMLLMAAEGDPAAFLAPFNAVLALVRWCAWAVAVVWGPLVLAAPWVLVLVCWQVGRRGGRVPGWVQSARDADTDAAIDETTIAEALKALRIPQVGDYLKRGLPLQYLTPARIDGRGTHAVIRLPAGVTAEKVARRRGDLATGLRRLAKEVWPTTGAEAGILDLWVADKGALAEGAGEYPLLHDGTVDVFKGVPFGKTLRGEPIVAPLMERNTITGGIPGQGKSGSARIIMAGAALDPTAELQIFIPDANFDFEVFRPRCSSYIMGAEDQRIAEILAELEDVHADVQRRGELLVRYEEPSVTRKLASAGVGLHPKFCLLEEAHVAIQHPVYGKDVSKLLCDIVRLGRKRAIHMIVSTQAPTKDSMPRDVTRNCSNGIAFAVGDHVANDALLGQGAYSAGHRATELIPGTDKGTAVVKGFNGERSQIIQVYFLDVSRDHDQVTPIIARSLEAVAELGGVPGGAPRVEAVAERDLLEDLAEVLGDEPVPAADVPALLARLAPQWRPAMSGKRLRELLADLGVRVPSTGNRFPVDPAAVREALARRDG